MSQKSIEQQIAVERLLLAYFSYPACNVCKVILPKIETLLQEYPTVKFVYINTEVERAVAGQNSVFTVPTIIFFSEGKELKRWSRNFSIADVDYELEKTCQYSTE